jgi:hypothetical protein
MHTRLVGIAIDRLGMRLAWRVGPTFVRTAIGRLAVG